MYVIDDYENLNFWLIIQSDVDCLLSFVYDLRTFEKSVMILVFRSRGNNITKNDLNKY